MTTADVARVLHTLVDPELGLDIVSLGLIYDIHAGDDSVRVAMTTTSRMCPMSAAIVNGVYDVLARNFPGVDVSVDVVETPPWDVAMVDRPGRACLGIS